MFLFKRPRSPWIAIRGRSKPGEGFPPASNMHVEGLSMLVEDLSTHWHTSFHACQSLAGLWSTQLAAFPARGRPLLPLMASLDMWPFPACGLATSSCRLLVLPLCTPLNLRLSQLLNLSSPRPFSAHGISRGLTHSLLVASLQASRSLSARSLSNTRLNTRLPPSVASLEASL